MSSPQKSTQKTTSQLITEYMGEDNLKDIKFSFAAFLAILVMIFHYAWIMRQMLRDFDMPSRTMYAHFGVFGITVVSTITVLVKYAYPRIYTQVVSEEKKKQ